MNEKEKRMENAFSFSEIIFMLTQNIYIIKKTKQNLAKKDFIT